jgi:hypothetical protein
LFSVVERFEDGLPGGLLQDEEEDNETDEVPNK